MKYFIPVSCLLALLHAIPSEAYGHGLGYASGHGHHDYYDYPSYAYENTVRDPHTGDNKAYYEKRDGDLVVGGFSFVEPGGSIRIVRYKADETGFVNTLLTRIGPKVHPGGATSTTEISKPASPIAHSAPYYRPYLPYYSVPYSHGHGYGYGRHGYYYN
ncbi:unnamed protein product [Colias eurytheme]|nr:unnamed protein product [Colias eurytheme]